MPSRPGRSVLFLCCLVVSLSGGIAEVAQDKAIRLRAEIIKTPPKAAVTAQSLAPEAAVSGLFLVQFNGPFEGAWREQLRAAGVELLRYVPDDAFIARLDNVRPGAVNQFSFVRWLGAYRPEYKIHSSVRHAETTAVRILLSPTASARDRLIVQRTLKRSRHQSGSRFGTILQGEVTPAELTVLSQSDAVLWIEPAPKMKLVDEISSKIVGGDDGTNGTRTLTQQLGFDGSGVTVAVADTGLNNGDAATMHPDLAGRVDAFLYYGSLTDAADEHSHGTHVTGIIAGNAATGETDDNGYQYGLGVAPGAHIVVQRVFDGVGNDELPAPETLTHDAVRKGAVIGSNSWGDDTQGRYDLSAAQFDALVRDADSATPGDQPYILEFSAGNAGPGAQTIDSPAVAKNVIATGASENDRFDFFIYADGQDTMADFSSRGPCEDGRIKPDVVAPGTWIASLQSASATADNAWVAIDDYYQYQGGTSQAGPHASGAAAVFVQYYRLTHTNATPSPALVKAALINSAVDMDDSSGTGPVPNMDEGWGRIDLTQLIGSPRRYEFIDQTNLLTTGQMFEHRVVVAGSDQPLKITLAYTDVPGLPAAIPALVNDLDLEVVAPGGMVYRGNQFDRGESVPDAAASDSINNVEGVHLSAPAPGEYIVRVRARNVVEDARSETPAVDQDFALVISGDLPLPGVGVLFFDRSAYTVPATLKIKLIDFDLAGQPSLDVLLTSSTETNGESITLQASGSLGVFTNDVGTATGPAVVDGRLQISHGDAIRATYQDASPGATRTATAVADLVPPVISDVAVTNRFGKAFISWNTDEPATTTVRYGTNSTLSLAVASAVLEPSHGVELDGLVVGATYQFVVISSDDAGNTATNDNNGTPYNFVAASAKNVLLVNAYNLTSDPATVFSDPSVIDLPVTAYTDALDRTGVSYDVWDVGQRGAPGTNDLRPFRIVIWRYNDNPLSDDTLSPQNQAALQSYVSGGGGLFLGGMEILTRIWSGSPDAIGNSFITNVLQVQKLVVDPGVPSVYGNDNDVVTSGMALDLDYTVFDSLTLQFISQSPDVSDTLTISPNAVPIFFDSGSGDVAGLRYPRTGDAGAGRVVFLSFPFDAVSATGTAPDNRANLLRNILSFLAPGVNGLGTITFDSPAYTIPSRITLEVGDSDLAGQGQTTVHLYSDSATNGLSVALLETARPGLFRGSLVLVNATNSSALFAQLRASNGDTVWADYFDSSANSIVRATADVDTVPPGITNVVATPDYETAEVSWDVSEPADALVQFKESTFPFPFNRTAYSGDFRTSHSITLDGLMPDQTYYFRVVSRDTAGNTTTDDNHGAFYSFHTLKPLSPPWFDNLDAGGTNWTVIDGDASQVSWRLGVPNNGWESASHSPPNAWGSNLNGDSVDAAESFLVSPAIDLSGGNVATLRFWHSYDFLDDNALYNGGEVLLIVNSTVVTLTQFGGDAVSWAEEVIDLTPYVGHVVFLAWHSVYFTFEATPWPGWLVDDVSVTVTNGIRGTVVITNNLAQAQFTLTGPAAQTGQGLSLTLTSLPLGQYAVAWSAVPFYQTPAPQTNDVTSATPVVFQGVYTIIDANTNGMSDGWEQQTFGTVAPERTQATDTDRDGMSDYAEFIAGTNPKDSNSKFEVPPPKPQPDGSVRFDWTSVSGRAYRMISSADLITWTPASDWVRASGTSSSLVLPPQAVSASYFYRIEVRP